MVRNGVSVLAAILIAFGLDAWWDDRDERRRTDDILRAMIAEFEAAEVQLDSIAQANQRWIEFGAAFVHRTGPGLPPIPGDSLRALAEIPIEGYQIYDPAFGALTTLISTGGLERIPDAELQSDLGGWTGEIDDLEFEERQLEFATQQLFLALFSEDVWRDPTDPDSWGQDVSGLRRLAASAPFRRAHMMLVTAIADYQRDIVRLRDRVAVLAERLERSQAGPGDRR